jgi:hypothetical protein
LTHRRRHTQHIRITGLSGMAAGEVGNALEAVSHGVWMNEQLAGAGFNRAARI